MNKDELKILAQAIKQRQPEQTPSVDESTLPPLPDLSRSTQSTFHDPSQLEPSLSTGNLSLDRHGLNFKSDNLQAHITPEKIQAQLAIRDALVKALVSKDGNASLNATTPLLGGHLDLGYGRNQGNNSYNLKYQKNF